VRGVDRSEAIALASKAISEFVIEGIDTTLGFHEWILKHDEFTKNKINTRWVDSVFMKDV
jgi:acetyl-CoA carboxylase biotin carboxylase subunit